MTPADEASQILIRMFDTLAAGMGKRLKEQHKTEIRRACELLATDGTLEPLEDAPRVSPAEAMVAIAEIDPGYREWKRQRAGRE
jgi:hypothetical protein